MLRGNCRHSVLDFADFESLVLELKEQDFLRITYINARLAGSNHFEVQY